MVTNTVHHSGHFRRDNNDIRSNYIKTTQINKNQILYTYIYIQIHLCIHTHAHIQNTVTGQYY